MINDLMKSSPATPPTASYIERWVVRGRFWSSASTGCRPASAD